MRQTQGHPAERLPHHFGLSPVDTLIDLKVGYRLSCPIPVGCPIWLGLRPVIHLRITAVIPQRWSARWGYVRGLGVHPDVIQNPPDLPALGDKGDQAHLPAT